jgi:hypothetical protein
MFVEIKIGPETTPRDVADALEKAMDPDDLKDLTEELQRRQVTRG